MRVLSLHVSSLRMSGAIIIINIIIVPVFICLPGVDTFRLLYFSAPPLFGKICVNNHVYMHVYTPPGKMAARKKWQTATSQTNWGWVRNFSGSCCYSCFCSCYYFGFTFFLASSAFAATRRIRRPVEEIDSVFLCTRSSRRPEWRKTLTEWNTFVLTFVRISVEVERVMRMKRNEHRRDGY